jgi:adenylate cyclase
MVTINDIQHGNILIVDDQEANVLLLEQMLRNAGYDQISSTMDPFQVCEMHLRNRYDLILLDLRMPGMDGFQVMENLKQIETGGYLPVLVITAQADHKLRALKAGAKDFVSKPFDLAEVLIRVHNMLEVRLLHREALRLCDQVVAEQKVSQRLLLSALPRPLAEILQGPSATAAEGSTGLLAEGYAELAVLFADIVAFTRFSEGAGAQALVGVLKEISSGFDSLADPAGLERRGIIGDAYLAAVGLPDAATDRTIRAANMALDLSAALDRFNAHSRCKLKLGIGLDPGPAVGVAVGKRRTRK